MKVFYSNHKEPYEVHGENHEYYFSEGFLEQGETYLLKLEKDKCRRACECGREMNWTWNYDYKTEPWTKFWYWNCRGCYMIQYLEKENERVDWKTRDWSNEIDEPVYPRDICHNCKYFMFHSLSWCYICGQKMSKTKISYAQMKIEYPDYRMGY